MTKSGFVRVIGRGIYADEMRGQPATIATFVVVDNEALTVTLRDGRRVSAPLDWYRRLWHAGPAERNDWRLLSGGRVVCWPSLELAVAVKAILEGTKDVETSTAARRWIDARLKQTAKKQTG